MGFENVCKSINAYFSNKKITAQLQPYAMIAALICGGLLVLSSIPGVSLGWVVSLVRVAFWFFFIMLLGSENFLMIAVALGLRLGESVVDELVDIFKYKFFSWSALVYIVVFALLAYSAYMKSVSGTNNNQARKVG